MESESYTKNEISLNNWYVLFVMTGQEDNVRKRLEYSFGSETIKPLLPRRILIERKGGKTYERVRTLFPGYIFIHTPVIDDIYFNIKRIPGVIKLLKDNTYPISVAPHEMQPLLALTKASEIIGLSTCSLTDGRIIVLNGPLKGYEGIIVSVDKRKGRAKVRMNIMGYERLVDLGLNIIGLV
jgi:transcriptional antiterminator NusG